MLISILHVPPVRSQQFFFLGTSLATILEIPNTADCLKALMNVLQEYDYFTAAESRSKSVRYLPHPR